VHDRSNAMVNNLVTIAAPENRLASFPEPKTMHQQADSKWHQTASQQLHDRLETLTDDLLVIPRLLRRAARRWTLYVRG